MSLDVSATLEPRTRAKPEPRSWWKLALRLALFAAVVWLIATHLSLTEILHAFTQLKAVYLVPVVAVLVPLTVLLRSVRWRWLLPAGQHLPLSSYVAAYLIGNLANSLLLGKFGDLVKAKVICDSKVDYGRSVTVVVIDRLFEGTALLLVFAGVLLTSTLPHWAYQLAWVAGAVAVGALLTLRIIFHHQAWFLKTSDRVLSRLPGRVAEKLSVALQRLIAGCEVLTDYRRMLIAFLYALLVWAVETAIVVLFLSAFSVHAPRLLAAVVLIVVVNFGMLVPISPGSIGVYQLLCVFALSLWGIDRQLAFALGVAMQTSMFVPLYMGGLVSILMLKSNRGKKASSPVLAR